jgi:hypothetical protein
MKRLFPALFALVGMCLVAVALPRAGAVAGSEIPRPIPVVHHIREADQAPPTEAPKQGGVPVPQADVREPEQAAVPAGQAVQGRACTVCSSRSIEHISMRVATQDFTRQQLEGKFWPEYFESVRVPEQWADKTAGRSTTSATPFTAAPSRASGSISAKKRPRQNRST